LGAVDRALSLDSTIPEGLELRFWYALAVGDTAAARAVSAPLLAHTAGGELAAFWRWETARVLGDSVALQRARQQLGGGQVELTLIGYTATYEGLPYDDWELALRRFEDSAVTERAHLQAMEQRRKIAVLQGRPREAESLRDSLYNSSFGFKSFLLRTPVAQAIMDVGYDSVAARVTRRLRAWVATHTPEDPNFAGSSCVAGVGEAYLGDVVAASAAAAVQARLVSQRGLSPGCEYFIEAMVEGAHPGPHMAALERLDSLSRLGAPPGAVSFVIAKLREAQGNLPAALAALRRRDQPTNPELQQAIPAMLREEGRLAALAGDTTEAIRAYQHYLTLRSDPEPAVKPEVDQVKAALARLVGEHGGRR
jgi:hypothetical protein